MNDFKVTLESRAPVQLLVGTFRGSDAPPANGPVLRNAATIRGQPPLDVRLLPFEQGKRTLTFSSACVILGVIPAGVKLPPDNAKEGER
jgi:hypothetical protein